MCFAHGHFQIERQLNASLVGEKVSVRAGSRFVVSLLFVVDAVISNRAHPRYAVFELEEPLLQTELRLPDLAADHNHGRKYERRQGQDHQANGWIPANTCERRDSQQRRRTEREHKAHLRRNRFMQGRVNDAAPNDRRGERRHQS